MHGGCCRNRQPKGVEPVSHSWFYTSTWGRWCPVLNRGPQRLLHRPLASLPDARAMLATAGRRRGRACTALACVEGGCQGIAGRQYSLWWPARFRRKRHRGWSLVPRCHRLGALLAGALSTREAPPWDTVLGCAWCEWAGMQRVHGLVFPDRSELIEHLWHNDRVCLCTGSWPVKHWSPQRSSL